MGYSYLDMTSASSCRWQRCILLGGDICFFLPLDRHMTRKSCRAHMIIYTFLHAGDGIRFSIIKGGIQGVQIRHM
jgi:hypothetical protein